LVDSRKTGRELKSLRKESQLSQNQLAERAEISVRHLSYIENGHAVPSLEVIERLATALTLSHGSANRLGRGWGKPTFVAAAPADNAETQRLDKHLRELLGTISGAAALAMDSTGKILALNTMAQSLVDAILPAPEMKGRNLFDLLLADDGFRPHVTNWLSLTSRVLSHMLQEQQLLERDGSQWLVLQAIIERYRAAGVKEIQSEFDSMVLFDIDLVIGGETVEMTSRAVTLGTPYDGSGQGIRIEMFSARSD